MLTRKQEERHLRLERFVSSARSLLEENGYDGMSVDELARRAEFTKRTVYLYFKDKREVFLAVALDDLSQLSKLIEESVVDTRSGRQNIESIATAFFDFARKHPKSFERIMDFESQDYFFKRPVDELGPFATQCVEVHNATSQLVVAQIEAGQEDKSIKSKHSPGELMLAVWASAIGAIQVIAMRKDRFRRKEYSTSEKRMYSICQTNLMKLLD